MQRQRNVEGSRKHRTAKETGSAKTPHNATTNAELIRVLRDLAATCRDAEEGFNKAAKGVHSDELRSLLCDYSAQREKFASELDGLVKRYGGVPGDTGHGSGPLRRGWRELEASIRPKADPEFMVEVADGEESGLKHYDHALAAELPDDVRQILEKQRRAVQRSVAQFRAGAGV